MGSPVGLEWGSERERDRVTGSGALRNENDTRRVRRAGGRPTTGAARGDEAGRPARDVRAEAGRSISFQCRCRCCCFSFRNVGLRLTDLGQIHNRDCRRRDLQDHGPARGCGRGLGCGFQYLGLETHTTKSTSGTAERGRAFHCQSRHRLCSCRGGRWVAPPGRVGTETEPGLSAARSSRSWSCPWWSPWSGQLRLGVRRACA